jgi:hypothetical protein
VEYTPDVTSAPDISLEDDAQKSVASGMAKFEKVAKNANSQKLDDYLKDQPKLREYTAWFRREFITNLLNFAIEARGTNLDDSASRVYVELARSFDAIILSVFQAIDINGNPRMAERIMTNSCVPVLHLSNDLPHGIAGTSNVSRGGVTLNISDYARSNSDPRELRNTIIHEFAHGFIESIDSGSYVRNPRLNEGITEWISTQVLGGSLAYAGETKIASALMALDKNAVLDWYTGGSDAEFYEELVDSLSGSYPHNDAVLIVGLLRGLTNFYNDSYEGRCDLKEEFLAPTFGKKKGARFARMQTSELMDYMEVDNLDNGRHSVNEKYDLKDVVAELNRIDVEFDAMEKRHVDMIVDQLTFAVVNSPK